MKKYAELPLLEQLKWDFAAFKDFEIAREPNWYHPDYIDVLYFPLGSEPFLEECAEIIKKYTLRTLSS